MPFIKQNKVDQMIGVTILFYLKVEIRIT